MKTQLHDPRKFDNPQASALDCSAAELATAAPAEYQGLLQQLSDRISVMLKSGEESLVRDALRTPSSSQACRDLLAALELALSPKSKDSNAVCVRVFTIPVLIVAGGSTSERIPGVLPDGEEIRALFETAGALGHCRNFGLSNALTALENIDAIPWTTLHLIAHSEYWDGMAALDVAPADIEVEANKEAVHLRFLAGAALTPGDAPDFVESAGDIGRWGIPLTKLLARQLTTQGASLLAIPRSPGNILRATREGWFAARELGFQLFLSNALRQARLRIGEPDVTVSACSDNSIRIRLTSPFDDLLDQTYGWPLTRSDDFETVVNSIFALLSEAKAERIQVVPTVEAAADATRVSH